jgi:DNA-binding CsgD family transcriptional regulator
VFRFVEQTWSGSAYRDSLYLWRDLGNQQYVGVTVAAIAMLAVNVVGCATVVRLLGATQAMINASGGVLFTSVRDAIDSDRVWTRAHAELRESTFSALLRAGREISVDAAVAEPTAVAERCRANERDASTQVLSARELEVARLVAQGLSNREIGERLVVATRIAETHLTNCLNKLGLHAPSQLAAWV